MIVAGCGGAPQAPTQLSQHMDMAAGQPTAPRFSSEALDVVRSEIAKEPKVQDFILDPANAVELQVAVRDDGSRRYGLASYFCEKLKSWQVSDDDMDVRIVDAAKVDQAGGDFRAISLGTIHCGDGTRLD